MTPYGGADPFSDLSLAVIGLARRPSLDEVHADHEPALPDLGHVGQGGESGEPLRELAAPLGDPDENLLAAE